MKLPHLTLLAWGLIYVGNICLGMWQQPAPPVAYERTHPTEILRQLETRK